MICQLGVYSPSEARARHLYYLARTQGFFPTKKLHLWDRENSRAPRLNKFEHGENASIMIVCDGASKIAALHMKEYKAQKEFHGGKVFVYGRRL